MKKTINLMILLLVFSMFLGIAGEIEPAYANTIKDRVEAAKGTNSISELEGRAYEAAESFITFLRNIAIVIAVIMFVIIAYALLFSPNVKTLADCKGRVAALIIAIAVAVMAEEIVGTLMKWFGA